MARQSRTSRPDVRIEPECGATYARDTFAVYEYGVYERSSVLRGQTRRQYLDGGFETVEEAKAKFPHAEVSDSCGYVAPSLSHLPDNEDGDLENYEREMLRREGGR